MLLNFIALVVTGVMRFVQPFSLEVTRVHMLCGLAVTVLVGLHILGRLRQMRMMVKGKDGWNGLPIILSLLFCGVYWSAAWYGWPGARDVVGLSYESRHKNEIFRQRSDVLGVVGKADLHTFKLATERSSIDVMLDWTKAGEEAEKSVAIWVETKSGSMIETLFISEWLRFSEDVGWEGGEVKRGEILPVWRNRYTAICGVGPDGLHDAISGPTKNHKFDLANNLRLRDAFAVYVEVNVAGDEQPSVLYVGLVDPESTNPYTLLSLLGTGEGAFKSGSINYDLSDLQSVKGVVEKVLVRTEWGGE